MSLILFLSTSLIRFSLWSGSILNCPFISDVALTFVLGEMYFSCLNKVFASFVSMATLAFHLIWQLIS